MSVKEESLEERKAEVLIKLRGYELVKKEKGKETISYIVSDPKEKKKILLWCVPKEGTVGVTSVSKLQKAMKEAEVEEGIIITGGRYTYTVKQEAKGKKVELLPKTFPVFDIFEHTLVPKHEILTEKEKQELLSRFKVQPYQLPKIKASDPAVKVIGAKPGDILRIIRKSPTAGEYPAYRYVVE